MTTPRISMTRDIKQENREYVKEKFIEGEPEEITHNDLNALAHISLEISDQITIHTIDACIEVVMKEIERGNDVNEPLVLLNRLKALIDNK